MEPRFRVRLDEMLDDAEVPPGLLRGVLPRLEVFLQPFVQALRSAEQQTNARHYVQGLLSDLDSKDVESIAYLHDRDRQGLQKFIGQEGSHWDERLGPPAAADGAGPASGSGTGRSRGHVGLRSLGLPQAGDGVRGRAAAVVRACECACARAGSCSAVGKIDNCQVGIYLGYVSRREHALVDVRLYLPREWARRKRRRQKAGVPEAVRFRTRHELALQMLDERGPKLPHAWISGDDEMGRSSWFRQELRSRQECYLLAVPCNTLIRDLAAPEPPYRGRGRPAGGPFTRVDRWCGTLPETAWRAVAVRDGEKGPVVIQAVRALVQARTEGEPSAVAELLLVFRERQGDGGWKHDYLLSNAPLGTTVVEFARVFKAQHRIEECLKRAKGEAGLGDDQVRTWKGWHHHQTLSLLATWFLTQETRRGKNPDRGVDGAAGARVAGGAAEPAAEQPECDPHPPHGESPFASQRGSATISLATA
jgi:DDE superfamily endonuclease